MLTLLKSGPELANVGMYFCAIEQKYNCATKMSTLYKYFNQSQNNWPSQVMTQREFLEHWKKKYQFKMPRIIRIFLKMIFMQPSYHRNLSSCKFRGTSYLKTPQLRFLEYFTIYMSNTCETLLQTCNFSEVSFKFPSINYFLMPFMFVYFHKDGLDAIKTKLHQAKVVTWTFW